LKKWVEDMYDISGSVDIHAFTLDICKEHQRAIAQTRKPAAASREKVTVAKEKLRTFNGSCSQWLRSKRELTAYLNQIVNEQGILIYYVIWDRNDEEEYRRDNGELGRHIYDAPFEGHIYENDAFQVLQILRQWTSGGTADTHVDNSNDVQDTWNRLLSQHEGIDDRNTNIQ
jgi:hypothetical protein